MMDHKFLTEYEALLRKYSVTIWEDQILFADEYQINEHVRKLAQNRSNKRWVALSLRLRSAVMRRAPRPLHDGDMTDAQ
jgi:L-rhamnose mutarotase